MFQAIEGNQTNISVGGYSGNPSKPGLARKVAEKQEKDQSNIWRNTPLRYIGYADEIGEAIEPYIGAKAVRQSYWVSAAYAMMDAFTSSRKAYQEGANKPFLQRWKDTLSEIGDAVLFHVPATIFVPALFIGQAREIVNYIASKGKPIVGSSGKPKQWSRLTNYLKNPLDKIVKHLHANPQQSAMLVKRAPLIAALAGISIIPLVGKPVDKAVDRILNLTYRRWVGKQTAQVQPQHASSVPTPQPPSVIVPPDTFQTLFN